MKILTKYVIRAHVGPFLFAFTAVTGLIYLNAIAQRIENLAGKGLGLGIIGEFLLLSLPHVIALTLPMSLLVATLYAFADLTGSNEVAAMAGGGIHPGRLLVPMLGVGLVVGGIVFFFNNTVLPEANHRLSSLLTDVGSKSPTFQLRDEVVNEIHTGDNSRYFLRARSVDHSTGRLEDVTIFDLTETGVSRTIMAERGQMAFTADLQDLYLTLDDGRILEFNDEGATSFQRLNYQTQVLPLRGVQEELDRQVGGSRSDREMDIGMLEAEVERSVADLRRVAEESQSASMEAVEFTLGALRADQLEVVRSPAPPSTRNVDPDEEAERQTARGPLLPGEVMDNLTSIHRINSGRWDVYLLGARQKQVEIHKKWAIAVACMIFVLLGPAIAMRFPQGGMGMTLAASVGIFFVYWMGLIGGERLADRGEVEPAVAMWSSNVILLLIALLLLWNIGDKISSNRGSAWAEFRFRVRDAVGRLFGSRRRRPDAGAA